MSEPTFTGKRLSRRERAQVRRRAKARKQALAAAATARATGGIGPLARSAPPRPAVPARPVAPVPGGLPPAPWLPGASAVSRGVDELEETTLSLLARLRGTWSRRWSSVGVVAGAVLVFVSLAVGLAVGGPVLGHPGRPVVALAGTAGVGAGGLWVAKAWPGAGRRLRAVTAVLAGLLCVTFTVGTLSDPVVVDGRVYLSTSPQARSMTLMQQIRLDLLALADADRYLTYDAAQAGAHHTEYPVLRDRLLEMSARYAAMAEDPSSWPAPGFGPVLESTTSAAYWAAQAVDSKMAVLDAGSARAAQELDARRGAYAQAVILAGQQLRALAAELDLPLTQTGPVE
jgi:hypothetical protein